MTLLLELLFTSVGRHVGKYDTRVRDTDALHMHKHDNNQDDKRVGYN